jgi:spore coat protein SA
MPWARLAVGDRALDLKHHVPFALFLRRNEFDAVQGHLYSYMRFLNAGLRVVHFHCDPYYVQELDWGLNLTPSDFSSIGRHSDAQVAVSEFIARELERGFAGRGNVHVVYNGVNSTHFDDRQWTDERRQLRAAWGMREEDVALLFSGAFVAEKGLLQLARAFRRVGEEDRRAHLVLAGASGLWGEGSAQHGTPSKYEQNVRATLDADPVRGRVHYLGAVAPATMPAAYAASDALVVPSIWREPFGLVALEAQASRRPVIASATGGLPEVVRPTTGLLVPPGDVDALAVALRELLERPRFRQSLGQTARVQAERFSWDAAAERLDEVYTGARSLKARAARCIEAAS